MSAAIIFKNTETYSTQYLKKSVQMRKIGIWMDLQKAIIITLTDEKEQLQTLFSEIEDYRPRGGSGTRFKGGPQDVVQDSKYLERKKKQMRVYFRNLASTIKDADSIALFGPADTPQKFREELRLRQQKLASKVKTVTKADSMTDNQIMALIRDFYN